jgi:DNA-binding protein H-NS
VRATGGTYLGKEPIVSRYKELLDQIAALQKQAEEARKQEIAAVVAEIKAKMAEYGITVEDLGSAVRGKGRRKASSGVAKYRNPVTGEQWTGKGRKPGWMVQALEQGKSMDDFRI